MVSETAIQDRNYHTIEAQHKIWKCSRLLAFPITMDWRTWYARMQPLANQISP